MDGAPKHDSLWQLAAAPLVWAAHLLLSYATAAIFCEKVAGRDGALDGARVAIAAFTAVALLAVGIIGWRAWKAERGDGGPALPHDSDSTEGRRRFMAFATLLLAGLSAVAIVYAALPALFIGSCA
jgi:hypothetical protein